MGKSTFDSASKKSNYPIYTPKKSTTFKSTLPKASAFDSSLYTPKKSTTFKSSTPKKSSLFGSSTAAPKKSTFASKYPKKSSYKTPAYGTPKSKLGDSLYTPSSKSTYKSKLLNSSYKAPKSASASYKSHPKKTSSLE